MKKQNTYDNRILSLSLPLAALVIYFLYLFFGFNNSSGSSNVSYTHAYPFILFFGYTFTVILCYIYIIKCKKESTLLIYTLPLMFFASLGMMRIDSAVAIISTQADYYPPIMFLVFFLSLIIMGFSSHTLTGAVFTVGASLLWPVFSLTFAPFITASVFVLTDKSKREKQISVTVNLLALVLCAVYAIIKLTPSEDIVFHKEYIPVIILVAISTALSVFYKKIKLIPFALLPLFPLISGIFFNAFPTEIITLSACVAATVIFTGNIILTSGNKEIKSLTEKLLQNPLIYIAIAYFILHTAFSMFSLPGIFRNSFVY